MVVLDEGRISVHDLDQALRDVHRIEDSGDDGELIVALHRFQNRVAALTSRKVGRFDREGGYAAVGALSMTQWLRHHCRLTGNEVCTARRLEELPAARQSFDQGDFSLTHASILARTVDEVGNQPNPDYSGQPGEARNVEETLVGSAGKLNPASCGWCAGTSSRAWTLTARCGTGSGRSGSSTSKHPALRRDAASAGAAGARRGGSGDRGL